MKQILFTKASSIRYTKITNFLFSNLKSVFLILFLCTCLIYSCKKSETTTSVDGFNDITNATIEKQREFLTTKLKQIVKAISPGFKNEDFRSFIISEMQRKFDGEAHILIQRIYDNPQFSTIIDKYTLGKSLNELRNIDGMNLYPQLYIPNFDLFYNGQPRRETDDREFVIYDGNDTTTVTKVYYLNEDGELIDKGYYADETYARNNEVFVVSINEAVNDDGGLPIEDTTRPIITTSNTDDTITVMSTESIINARIKDITVKDPKESWLAGDAEVNIKAWLSTWNGRANGSASGAFTSYSSIRSANNYQGFTIVKAPRSEITSGIGCIRNNINYSLQTSWNDANFYTNPIAYTYVIFEYDKWPAKTRTGVSSLVLNGSQRHDKFVTFRSSNSPYGGANVTGFINNSYVNYAMYANASGLPSNLQGLININNYIINTNDIYFKTQVY